MRAACLLALLLTTCARTPGFTIPVCDAPDQNCRCFLTGFIQCDHTCVDPRWDHDHCGGCGHSCGSGVCVDGVCAASCGALTTCGDHCLHADDPYDCSGCGDECDYACVSGTCGPRPSGCDHIGRTFCDGVCIDTQADASNCGACGHVCTARTSCVVGVCQ